MTSSSAGRGNKWRIYFRQSKFSVEVWAIKSRKFLHFAFQPHPLISHREVQNKIAEQRMFAFLSWKYNHRLRCSIHFRAHQCSTHVSSIVSVVNRLLYTLPQWYEWTLHSAINIRPMIPKMGHADGFDLASGQNNAQKLCMCGVGVSLSWSRRL